MHSSGAGAEATEILNLIYLSVTWHPPGGSANIAAITNAATRRYAPIHDGRFTRRHPMDQRYIDLYDEFTHTGLPRRVFMERLTKLAGSTAAATAIASMIGPNY